MFGNYLEIRSYLESFIPLVYGKEELGLARIENLLNKLGNPQKKFKSILVGGTAGKGSTAFYISRLLEEKGLKVGLHVSPHLIYIGERMVINGKEIPVKRLVGLVGEIKPVIDAIRSNQPELLPSYFEILVALSFLYFKKEKVDFAVVEVGLGGRLDATNVLGSEISVITNVGLDHTEILGDTIEKIAREKAGIIKKNALVITAATGKSLEVIKKAAKEENARLINFNTLSKNKTAKTDIARYIARYYYTLRSQGRSFAYRNLNLALLTVLSLGIKVDADNVKKAFSAGFSGRFEEIDDGVVVDGAHNADKIKALISFIKNNYSNKNISLVLAFKKGKNWPEIIDLLMKNLPVKKIIATQYFATTDTGKGSAVDPKEIAEYLDSRYKMIDIRSINNSQEAVFEAVSGRPDNDLVIVTGSLYLVGEARTLWKLPEF